MFDQTMINWLLCGFGALIGFILNIIWQAVKDLQKNDKDLTTKISEIEVLVAGDYVKSKKFDDVIGAMFLKLDRISEKLDKKQDRS